MKLRTALSAILIGLASFAALAQEVPHVHLKHRVFAQWGYNRAQYSLSNIHFEGPDYDFILHDVAAVDKPEPFSFRGYFSPANIWIPQYNYRVGWFLNERWSISLGLDHMKYVMVQDQDVRITGNIAPQRSATYAGSEDHTVALTTDFLRYEHTDGLNLLSVDADVYEPVWNSTHGAHALYLTAGACIGPVIPRTDVRLFGVGLNNKFHLAGYGAALEAGFTGVFWNRLLVRAMAKGGYIELPSVLTTGTDVDRARQHFWFMQEYATVGVLIGK